MDIGKGLATIGIWVAVAVICSITKTTPEVLIGGASITTIIIWVLG